MRYYAIGSRLDLSNNYEKNVVLQFFTRNKPKINAKMVEELFYKSESIELFDSLEKAKISAAYSSIHDGVIYGEGCVPKNRYKYYAFPIYVVEAPDNARFITSKCSVSFDTKSSLDRSTLDFYQLNHAQNSKLKMEISSHPCEMKDVTQLISATIYHPDIEQHHIEFNKQHDFSASQEKSSQQYKR